MRHLRPRIDLAMLVALPLSALAAAQATAQETLLDARSSLGGEIATLRTDSMRLLVPLHVLLGGIVFPDGTVLSTAAGLSTVTTTEIQDGTIVNADIAADAAIQDTKLGTIQTQGTVLNSATTATAFNTANAIVARNADGGFYAGPITLTSAGSFTALVSTTTGAAGGGRFLVQNTSSNDAAVYGATNGGAPAIWGETTGTSSAGRFTVQNASSNATGVSVATNGSGRAFEASTTGTGSAGVFTIQNTANGSSVLNVTTNGGGPGVHVVTNGTAGAGSFQVQNTGNAVAAVRAFTNGSGTAVSGSTTGTGSAAAFSISNPASIREALFVGTDAAGLAARFRTTGTGGVGQFQNVNPANASVALVVATGGTGSAGEFTANNTTSSAPALHAITTGTGAAVQGETNNSGPAGAFSKSSGVGDILVASTPGDVEFRVEWTGNVFADGTFTAGGADMAESFAVEGDVTAYGPGDVLVVSRRTDGTVEKSMEAYSTLVAGVYATKPGVLLGEHEAEARPDDEIPLGVVGVIPTKVTVEGGSIRRGDLLVTSPTPGHAMRAAKEQLGFGMVLGKALEPFDGPGTGVIRVLVSVR